MKLVLQNLWYYRSCGISQCSFLRISVHLHNIWCESAISRLVTNAPRFGSSLKEKKKIMKCNKNIHSASSKKKEHRKETWKKNNIFIQGVLMRDGHHVRTWFPRSLWSKTFYHHILNGYFAAVFCNYHKSSPIKRRLKPLGVVLCTSEREHLAGDVNKFQAYLCASTWGIQSRAARRVAAAGWNFRRSFCKEMSL